MDFFLETPHNGECGFRGYFYDQEKRSWSVCLNAVFKYLISWSHPESVSTQAEPEVRSQEDTSTEI